jgi:acyl-coenzyme A thioesterase PaaI-like protein
MSDLPPPGRSVPARLGVLAEMDGDDLVLSLVPRPEHLHHGRVRASVHAFLVDLICGLRNNIGFDLWTLTNDLSLRALPVPAPARITARATSVRKGRRTATWSVDIDATGEIVAIGAAGFVILDRRPGDPPKPDTSPASALERFTGNLEFLSSPLREEAAIESIDPRTGTVEVDVTHELLNTNGTMQGAMIALVAESAAEDFVQSRYGVSAVISELDIRYLNRIESGRLRATCRMLGDGPTATIEVRLEDLDRERNTTLVYARATVID